MTEQQQDGLAIFILILYALWPAWSSFCRGWRHSAPRPGVVYQHVIEIEGVKIVTVRSAAPIELVAHPGFSFKHVNNSTG